MRKGVRMSLMSLALANALGAAGAEPVSDDPVAIVRALYAHDKTGDWAPVFDNQPTALMHKYFTPEFNALWAQAMEHNKHFPVFDADPLSGAQEGGRPMLTDARQDGDGVRAKIVLSGASAREVRFVMRRRVDGSWAVHDIVYAPGRSLRLVLEAAR